MTSSNLHFYCVVYCIFVCLVHIACIDSRTITIQKDASGFMSFNVRLYEYCVALNLHF